MRTHIDYGIYFNNDFCQIARIEEGMPVIIHSDLLKESMPTFVAVNPRKNIIVGDAAYVANIKDKLRLLKTFGKDDSNCYSGFINTLGTNLKYHSSLLNKDFSSEELLAECFKKLKSFVEDENVRAVVITVPAKFLNLQMEAVKRAGQLAGFEQIELIQEPIAASIAYGLDSKEKDGKWLVFDFGGGAFDAALVKVDEGIMKVLDTEGNNELGGKDLDLAIVDNIIIPYLKENYSIEGILANKDKREILRNAMKSFAEKAKIDLSFNSSTDITCYSDEIGALDDDGNELSLNIDLTQQDLARASSTIYQKALDISIDLLKRNNKKGKDIEKIILVGEETYSPILRNLLKEQISDKVDSSVDPMTVVAKGAALFASTIPISEDVKEKAKNNQKLQLELKYNAATIELDELINVKILRDKSIGDISDKVYAEIIRFDRSSSSGKILIREKPTLIEVLLTQEPNNLFQIRTFDELGNYIECEPNQFSIQYGIDYLPKAVLPYNIGIAKYFESEGKELFQTIKGLEKNKTLPAIGIINGYKTKFDLRPGVSSDVIRFPIYQGDYNAEGTNPLLNNHVCDILISGETLPALLPAGSDIDITFKVDRMHLITISAYFPCLNHTEEVEIKIRQTELVTLKTIDDLKGELVLFYSDNPSMGKERFRFLLGELIRIEKNGVSEDEKLKVVDIVKKEILKWT